MELADQHNLEAEGAVAGAEIPVSGESPSTETASPASVSPAKPEKPLSLKEQIQKSVETVRTEEAKRAHDVATGKFVPKTEAEKLAAAEKPATEIPKPATEAKPADSNPSGPPPIWKGIWDKLTPEAQALAVKRETEVAKGFDEYRTKTAQLQEISQIFDPVRALLQQSGITSDVQAVKALAQWESSFRNPQTRVQAFHNLAKQYGVDLSTLAQNPSQAPSQVQDIPEPLRPVIDQFGNIVQQVQSVESRLQSWEQNQVSEKLTAFAKDKPHFEKVRGLMGQLMQGGAATDLESAYQQAIKIHPEVSASIEAERVKNEAAERERTHAEKAASARRAAVSPAGRSPNGAPVNGAAQPGRRSVKESILSSISELRDGQRA